MGPLGWSLTLLVLSIIFIGLEVLIPSAGIMAVLAIVSIVSCLVVAFQGSFELGMFMSLANVVVIPAAIMLGLRVWPHTPIGKRIFMQRPKEEDVLPESDAYQRQEMIGELGTAKSDLLPSGAVVIENRTYEALSEGMAINAGESIKVVAVRTNRLVVKRASEADLAKAMASEDENKKDDLLSKPLEDFGLDSLEDPLA